MGMSDDNLLSLYKAQYKLGPVFQKTILSQVQSHCAQGAHQTVCLWNQLPRLDGQKAKFTQALHAGPPAARLHSVVRPAAHVAHRGVSSSRGQRRCQLDAIGSAKQAGLYNAFGQYLTRAADVNPDMKQILVQKAEGDLCERKGI